MKKQRQLFWKPENKGKFSVKSTYNALTSSEGGPTFKHIWKGKIPAKIKISLWLMENNAILTEDNMIKGVDTRPILLFL